MCSPRRGAWRWGCARRAGQAAAGGFHEAAPLGVVEVHEVAPVRELGIGQALGAVLDRVGGDPRRLAALRDVVGRTAPPSSRRRPRPGGPAGRGRPGAVRSAGSSARSPRPSSSHSAEPAVVVLAGDGDPAVLPGTGEHAVGGHGQVVVAHAGERRTAGVGGRRHQRRGEELQGGLGLAHLDEPAGAAPGAVQHAGHDRHQQQVGRGVVGVRQVRSGGGPVGPAGDLVAAGERPAEVAVTGQLDQRPVEAEQADRHVHDRRVERPHRLVVEADRVPASG